MLKRIIPVLLLSGKGLVKTINFKDPKYVGDAINAVKIFSEKEVDEIVFMDIETSKKGNAPNYTLIKSIATEAYMPFAYGGGIKTLKQAETILKNGAEKVIINSAFWTNPFEVTNMIKEFGSQSVVLCLDVKKTFFGSYRVYNYQTHKNMNTDFLECLKICNETGFGELIIQSVDCDGQRKGYDTSLIKITRSHTELPLVALGGAGVYEDLQKAFQCGCDAAAAGSLFTFYGKYRAVLINYPNQKEIKRLINDCL